MYSVLRVLVTSLLAFSLTACAGDDFDKGLGSATESVSADAIGTCPIPDLNAIPGHEAVFYQCAEQFADFGHGCGESGYFLGYGSKYAQRFYKQARPRMSARGQKWIDDVLVCLQHDLREAIDETTSCDEIWTTAFDSHPSCYVRSGFCSLSPLDIAQVVWTIDSKDWLSRDAARQVLDTASTCSQQFASWFAVFFSYLRDN